MGWWPFITTEVCLNANYALQRCIRQHENQNGNAMHCLLAFFVLEGSTSFDCRLEQVQRNRDPHCVDTHAKVEIKEVEPTIR